MRISVYERRETVLDLSFVAPDDAGTRWIQSSNKKCSIRNQIKCHKLDNNKLVRWSWLRSDCDSSSSVRCCEEFTSVSHGSIQIHGWLDRLLVSAIASSLGCTKWCVLFRVEWISIVKCSSTTTTPLLCFVHYPKAIRNNNRNIIWWMLNESNYSQRENKFSHQIIRSYSVQLSINLEMHARTDATVQQFYSQQFLFLLSHMPCHATHMRSNRNSFYIARVETLQHFILA